jgi:CTP synthase (UTP-ammonia lyase)
MDKRIQIGLVGDFDENIPTLVALNNSIEYCRPHLSFSLKADWIPTGKINEDFLASHPYDGFWVVPGSPYKNDEGVYELIRFARENNFPLYGTCGGFQYMVAEYARNVLGFTDVGHEETDPHAEKLVISKLACSLKGMKEEVTITDKTSWLFETLQVGKITGSYFCSYGVNPRFTKILDQYPFVFTAFSPGGEPRAFELKAHRFYAATLFQPSLDSTAEKPGKLLLSFFNKCSHQ